MDIEYKFRKTSKNKNKILFCKIFRNFFKNLMPLCVVIDYSATFSKTTEKWKKIKFISFKKGKWAGLPFNK